MREEKEFFGDLLDLSEMTVQVENDAHKKVLMTVNGENNTVQAAEVNKVASELGGDVPINGNSVVDTDGELWEIV